LHDFQLLAGGRGRWAVYDPGRTSGEHYTIIKHLIVARFFRKFPYFPCELDGITKKSNGPLFSNMSEIKAYLKNNEGTESSERPGGFFPIGANRTWHGGIHLYPKKNSSIYALSDGIIVAARIPSIDKKLKDYKKERNLKALPSRNFILIRHQVKINNSEKVFFSLYYDLNGDPGNKDVLLKSRWLWKLRNFNLFASLKKRLENGDVVRLAEPIGAGEIIAHAEGGINGLHFEIFSEDIVFDGVESKHKIDEKDSNLFVDRSGFVDLLFKQIDQNGIRLFGFDIPWFWEDGVLRDSEIREFFASNPKKSEFRQLVCRHISEWSTKIDWKKLKDLDRWGYEDSEDLDKVSHEALLYSWLNDSIAKHIGLKSHIVWTYHPLTFMGKLLKLVQTGKALQMEQKIDTVINTAAKEYGSPAGTKWKVTISSGLKPLKGHATDNKPVTPFDPIDGAEKVKKDKEVTQKGEIFADGTGNELIQYKESTIPSAWLCIKGAGGQNYAELVL